MTKIVSSSYGTLGKTKVLVGVTTVEVDQFMVERQMLATEILFKASWLYKATVASLFARPHTNFERPYTFGLLTDHSPSPPTYIVHGYTIYYNSRIWQSVIACGEFNENMDHYDCKLLIIVH